MRPFSRGMNEHDLRRQYAAAGCDLALLPFPSRHRRQQIATEAQRSGALVAMVNQADVSDELRISQAY